MSEMDYRSLEEPVYGKIAEALGLNLMDVSDNIHLNPTDRAQIAMALEDDFGIVPDGVEEGWETAGDVVKYIREIEGAIPPSTHPGQPEV